MQRIEIDEIIKNLKTLTDNDRKIEIINGNIIKLNGIDNSLEGKDFSKNREPSSKKVKYFQDFVKGYINQKGIKFCPYCGKNYISYFEKKDGNFISGFDIEHFFPKSKYSQLAKNLYNWHLSCIICNQRLKGSDDPLKNATQNDPIFNPYFGWIYKIYVGNEKYIPYIVSYILTIKGIDSTLGFSIKVENSTFDNKVTFVGNPKPEIDGKKQVYKTHHGKFFRLGEIYLNDQETFNIFNFIYDKYTKIKDEYQRFKKNSKSIEEFIDYFFKNYYPEKEQDILKYSNGKLKKDLIQYMEKILKNYYK